MPTVDTSSILGFNCILLEKMRVEILFFFICQSRPHFHENMNMTLHNSMCVIVISVEASFTPPPPPSQKKIPTCQDASPAAMCNSIPLSEHYRLTPCPSNMPSESNRVTRGPQRIETDLHMPLPPVNPSSKSPICGLSPDLRVDATWNLEASMTFKHQRVQIGHWMFPETRINNNNLNRNRTANSSSRA